MPNLLKTLDNKKLLVAAVLLIVLSAILVYVYCMVYSTRAKKEYVASIPINDKIGLYNLDTMTDAEFTALDAQFKDKCNAGSAIITNLETQFLADAHTTTDLIPVWRASMEVKTRRINDGIFCGDPYQVPYEENSPAVLQGSVNSFIKGEITVPYELASSRLSSMPILTSLNVQ